MTVIGCVGVSSYRFRLACSFVALSVSAAFPLGALEANSYCRLEAFVGVPFVVLPRFVVLTGSIGGANSVSHCATVVPIFLPSLPLTDSMAAHRPSAISTVQSTFTSSYAGVEGTHGRIRGAHGQFLEIRRPRRPVSDRTCCPRNIRQSTF